jgi:hypothetical protein
MHSIEPASAGSGRLKAACSQDWLPHKPNILVLQQLLAKLLSRAEIIRGTIDGFYLLGT